MLNRSFLVTALVVSLVAACGTTRRKSKSGDAESSADVQGVSDVTTTDGTDGAGDIGPGTGDDATVEPTGDASGDGDTGEPIGDATDGPDNVDGPDAVDLPDTWIDSDVPLPPDTDGPPDIDGPPDTFVPDTFVPDTFVPDTFVPDDLGAPDTFVPDDLGTPDTADIGQPGTCSVYSTIYAGVPVSGDTTDGPQAVGVVLGQCGPNGDAGAAAPEHVWRFTAPDSQTYTFTLLAAFDSALYVLGACDSGATCYGLTDLAGSGLTETVSVTLAAGETVFAVVDGYQAIGAGDAGPYDLRVDSDCQPYCAPGACGSDGCGGTCACSVGTCNPATLACETGATGCAPIAYLTCGSSYSLDTINGANAYADYGNTSVCKLSGDNYSGPELAVQINVAENTTVTVTEGGTSLDLFLFEGVGGQCGVSDAQCVTAAYDTLSFKAVPSKDYFAIVDSYIGDPVSSTITVECCTPNCLGKTCGDDGCGGSCGTCGLDEQCVASKCQSTSTVYGDVCLQPVALALGANLIDTRYLTDQYTKDCTIGSGVGAGAADAVVSVTAELTGSYRLTVDPISTADFYAIATCDTACSTIASAIGAKFLDLPLTAGQTAYVIIDGLIPAAVANALTVTLTPPTVEHAQLVINELDYDQAGDDATEYVELYNKGNSAATLANYTLEFVNGADNAVYRSISLADGGVTLPAGAFLVIGSQPIIDSLPSNVARILVTGPVAGWIQNGGPDGIRIVESGFLVDGVSYEGILAGVGEGASAPSDDNGILESLSRCPNAADIGNNSVDFSLTQYLTPGATNNCAVPPPSYNAAWGVFQTKCTPCHSTGGSGGHNIGGPVASSAYSQSQLASYFVPGSTKGAAALARIKNGSMPAGAGCTGTPSQDVGKAGCVTAAEQGIINAWIVSGQPGPN